MIGATASTKHANKASKVNKTSPLHNGQNVMNGLKSGMLDDDFKMLQYMLNR